MKIETAGRGVRGAAVDEADLFQSDVTGVSCPLDYGERPIQKRRGAMPDALRFVWK
jgi:hypothetical protein